LLLVLEKARQAQSRWAPYISILPESFGEPGYSLALAAE
jgi:hypothetical protein